MKTLNETYKITSANNLWIRSCSSIDKIDLARINSTDPLYLTQDPDYAYYYCVSKKTDDSIAIVQVVDGELCHLYDANDYTSIAQKSHFPPQMSEIFKLIEPYFSFNTTPSINVKRGRVPQQYLDAAAFVIDFNRQQGVKSKNIAQLMLNQKYVPCGDTAIEKGLDNIVVGYVQAFDAVHEHIKSIPNYVKHKYVDILQFAFFDMLKNKLGYRGYYCPEHSRESQATVLKDYKKDAYYFGHSGHTHPCIAMFDKDAIEVKAIIPKEAFYIEFANIIYKDSYMLKYSSRSTLFSQIISNYESKREDMFVDRFYNVDRVKDAKHKIQQVLTSKADPVTRDLPKEKRTRDQI